MNAIGHTPARFNKRAGVGTIGILEWKFLLKTRTMPVGRWQPEDT
jgi:hypothetical protein